MVTNSEPTALTDAYSLIKIIYINNLNNNINVVINRVKNSNEAIETYNKLYNAVVKFLNKDLKYLGYLIEDSRVSKAIKDQTPYMKEYPNGELSKLIDMMAVQISGGKLEYRHKSIKDYFEKLFKVVGSRML